MSAESRDESALDAPASPMASVFRPTSVAVAGVSAAAAHWGGGQMFLNAVRRMGKIDHVYALNPKGGRLADGSPIYRSLHDVPGPAEFLISAVPASAVLGLLEDAAATGVKVIHLFTAGFRETGQGDRSALEEQVRERARAAGIRLVGPNCMGVYSSIGGMAWDTSLPRRVGRIGVVSQSGMLASGMLAGGERRGLAFSHAVSYGNASDLTESDFLDFFADDGATDLVLAYIEGVTDGSRFLRAAKRVGLRKPLVVVKGGLTESGRRAASSHTGSLAGSAQVWAAVSRQSGLISVGSVDEALDMAVALQRLAPLPGPRVALIGSGGGASVLAADACERHGVPVPWFSDATQRRLRESTPLAGNSVRNPLDHMQLFSGSDFPALVATIADDPHIDFLCVHFGTDRNVRQGPGGADASHPQLLRDLGATRDGAGKPIALVLRSPQTVEGMQSFLDLQSELSAQGFAVFPSIERLALAVQRTLEWQQERPAPA